MTPDPSRQLLTIENVDYYVDELPAEIQGLIKIYDAWHEDLAKARVEVFKIEAAIKGLSLEIEARVNALKAPWPRSANDGVGSIKS